MSFKIVLLAPDVDESWPQKIRQAVPGAAAKAFRDPNDALVDVGGAGSEAATLCAALGMKVLGADPRVTNPPTGVAELFTPDRLGERIGEADFVIVTTPETPETRGMFDSRLFSKMKRGSYFINISRGGCVVTEDLIAALR